MIDQVLELLSIIRRIITLWVPELWRRGNHITRLSIILITSWPVAIIIIALAGVPTLTAIVALMPAIALIVLAVQMKHPVLLPIFATIEGGQTVMRWIATIVGVELAIGLYFAIVPINNRPALVPILILAMLVALLLSVGVKSKITGFAKSAAVITIIVVTIMFFAADKKWQKKTEPPPTPAQAAPQQQPKQDDWVKDQESGLMVKQTSHEVVPKGGAKIKQSVEDDRGFFTTDCKNSPLNLDIDVAPGEEVEVRHIVESVAKMNRCSYDMRGNAHPVAEAASMIVMDRWRNEIFFSDLPPYSYVLSLGKPGESQIAKIFESDGEHITLRNNTQKTLPLYFTFNYINKKDWMRQVGWDGSSISFEAVKL